jgi:glucose-1-phosphate cytidylyltransferase
VLCLGYKAEYIKQYFLNYFLYNSDVTVELEKNKIDVHFSNTESFKITLADTGLYTNTAGRLKRVQKYLNGERFMLTYGDVFSDINIDKIIDFHEKSGKLVTLTSVKSPGRFGNLDTDEAGTVIHFDEKPDGDGMWINGGFFVIEPGVFNYLDEDMDAVQWEIGPLANIARDGQLAAYRHHGFWKCMDALRDRTELEKMWNSGEAKWKTWE